jgi:Family of unknown function (DUF6503)
MAPMPSAATSRPIPPQPPALLAGVLLALVLSASVFAAPSADELLADAIAYHDPEGLWGRTGVQLTVEESRPDGSKRETLLEIDPQNEHFLFRTRAGSTTYEGQLDGEECITRVNGSEEISKQDRREYRLTCERVLGSRNYYTYLWGLPMKLRDAGTILHSEVRETTFAERPALEVKVTYEEGVGTDTWYVYFDPATHALTGYRFYHDEAKGDGEYIHLVGETEGAGLRLPRERAWYTHKEDEYLGTDTLVRIEKLGG